VPDRMVVIGGDAAGMSAASQARQLRGPDDLEIIAFERGSVTSYSACGIPYLISGIVGSRDDLVVRDPETFRHDQAIDVRVRHEVTAIDLDRREVVATSFDHGGREVRESYDFLVYATGAVPAKAPWGATTARGVFGVQTLDDASALRNWLGADPLPRRAVVVGGGYIGVEMAEALIRRGLDVTLIERGEQPMSTVDPDMGAKVRAAICGLGVDVRTGVSVTGLGDDGERITEVHTDAGPVPADVVVLGLGMHPNTALAAGAGLPLGITGGVRTDLRMRVDGLDGVWAAGDCVETYHRVSRQPVHMPLGTHANKQGRVIGINIGGHYATFPGVIGTAVTKVCDLEVARTGLLEREASKCGYAFITATVESNNRAGYFPGSSPMTIKLIAERHTGQLLGAQIVGTSEAAKRIDVLAVAVWNRMTVAEMTALDLGYAPPYSPVWDPVLVAARRANRTVAATA